MNSFNEPTEKTGYLEQDFRLFHIKDQTKREFSYHYHDFHKVIIFLSGKKDDHLVKIMIMVGKFPLGLVLDVKKPEILLQIAGFFSWLIERIHMLWLLF